MLLYPANLEGYRSCKSILLSTFLKETYRELNVKNRIVIDVGVYIGDTAIYSALKEASKMYAIEPHPYAYELLVKNVKNSISLRRPSYR